MSGNLRKTFRRFNKNKSEYVHSKFFLEVSVSGGFSLCVGPKIDWRPVQGAPCVLPVHFWYRRQLSCDPELD